MAAEGASAPEFQTINETTVGAYLNYMRYVVGDGIYVDTPSLPYYDYSDYTADFYTGYGRQLELVTDAAALVRHLGLVLCAGQLSAESQKVIVDALNATPVTKSSTADEKRDRIAGAIFPHHGRSRISDSEMTRAMPPNRFSERPYQPCASCVFAAQRATGPGWYCFAHSAEFGCYR